MRPAPPADHAVRGVVPVSGWVQPVVQLVGVLVASFVVRLVARKGAERRTRALKEGRAVAWACRAQWGRGPLRRGKLVVPGFGKPLTFYPRFGKPWGVPADGHVVGMRDERTGMWDNPHIGVTSLFYQAGRRLPLRLRLRSTDVSTVETALGGAWPVAGRTWDAPRYEPARLPVRRWWLTALAGALVLGLGCGLTAFADWHNHDVVVNVLSTDRHAHCVVSWRDPWTHERRKSSMACPDDEWVGGPLQAGDRADAEVAGRPFHGEVYGSQEEYDDPLFSAGVWIFVLGSSGHGLRSPCGRRRDGQAAGARSASGAS